MRGYDLNNKLKLRAGIEIKVLQGISLAETKQIPEGNSKFSRSLRLVFISSQTKRELGRVEISENDSLKDISLETASAVRRANALGSLESKLKDCHFTIPAGTIIDSTTNKPLIRIPEMNQDQFREFFADAAALSLAEDFPSTILLSSQRSNINREPSTNVLKQCIYQVLNSEIQKLGSSTPGRATPEETTELVRRIDRISRIFPRINPATREVEVMNYQALFEELSKDKNLNKKIQAFVGEVFQGVSIGVMREIMGRSNKPDRTA